MSIIATWNGQHLPLDELRIPALDRSYLFGDGVYEVIRVYGGRPFLLKEHLDRLKRNLDILQIAAKPGIEGRVMENLARNQAIEATIYLQVSRGDGPRSHSYFGKSYQANELIYTSPWKGSALTDMRAKGASAITSPDLRSALCHIKTVNLLPNCIAKSNADRLGAQEAILVDRNGRVTEGSSTNVFIVKDGAYLTPPAAGQILPGITRAFLLDLLQDSGESVREHGFSATELAEADEVFLTGTTTEVVPVTLLDDKPIGNGEVGPYTKKAQKALAQVIERLRAGK